MSPQRSCHPERSEGSAQRSIGPAGPPGRPSGHPGPAMQQDARRPAAVRASAPHRLEDPSGSALRMTPESFGMPRALTRRGPCHAEGPVMPMALAYQGPCHPERSEGSAQRSIGPAEPPGRPSGHPGPATQQGARRPSDPSSCGLRMTRKGGMTTHASGRNVTGSTASARTPSAGALRAAWASRAVAAKRAARCSAMRRASGIDSHGS